MFTEQQHIRSPPPLSYLDAASNSSENDSYASGAFAKSKNQGRYNVKRHEHGKNPCKYLFRCIRSNISRVCRIKEDLFVCSRTLGNTTNRTCQL